MVRKLLCAILALTFVGPGIVRADEPPRDDRVTPVADRAALLEHVESLSEGDAVLVVTDEGGVVGDVVEKTADELILDRPLVEGGAERVVVPLKEIQGLQVGSASRHSTKGRIIVIAAIVGAVVTVLALGMFRPMP